MLHCREIQFLGYNAISTNILVEFWIQCLLIHILINPDSMGSASPYEINPTKNSDYFFESNSKAYLAISKRFAFKYLASDFIPLLFLPLPFHSLRLANV